MRERIVFIALILVTLSVRQAIPAEPLRVAETANESADFDEFEDEFPGSSQGYRTGPVSDPLHAYNRIMYKFNDKVYFWALKPISTVYGKIIPQKGRIGISRVFINLGFPARFLNSILQLKFKRAVKESARFVVNSTFGILGLFDPAASHFKWTPSKEDFGQTLGYYGVPGGFPIVLPFIGPSNLRDIVGMVPDYFLNPIVYIDGIEAQMAVRTGERANFVSLHIGEYESLKKEALDPYTFIRDAYKQNRNGKIKE